MREKLNVHLVEELGEVLALTLRGATFREGRLLFASDQPAGGGAAPQPGFQH